MIDGKRYGHILDPRTGMPVDEVLGVTVTAPTATLADALSTGMFVMGPDKSRGLCERYPGVGAVFVLPGAERELVGNLGGKLELHE